MIVLGYHALQNKKFNLLKVAFWCIFLPQFLFVLCINSASQNAVKNLVKSNNSDKLQLFFSVFEQLSSSFAIPFTVTTITCFIGVLMMARISHNYFLSRQESNFQTLKISGFILAKKGLGTFTMLALLLPILTLIPMIRAITMSLLFMLPMILICESKGGFKTVWNTIFLRYALPQQPKWHIFINVLTISGLLLSFYLGLNVVIEWIPTADLLFDFDQSIFERSINFGPLSLNSGIFVSQLLSLSLESITIAATIPFTAAIYQHVTHPGFIKV
jgi:hypothetical protein